MITQHIWQRLSQRRAPIQSKGIDPLTVFVCDGAAGRRGRGGGLTSERPVIEYIRLSGRQSSFKWFYCVICEQKCVLPQSDGSWGGTKSSYAKLNWGGDCRGPHVLAAWKGQWAKATNCTMYGKTWQRLWNISLSWTKKNIWLYLNVNPGHNAALLSRRTELSRMKLAEICSDEQFARHWNVAADILKFYGTWFTQFDSGRPFLSPVINYSYSYIYDCWWFITSQKVWE